MASMDSEQSFHTSLDELMMAIEDRLDEVDIDIDVDGGDGQLILTFLSGSQIVVSRQPAQREVWVAAKSGGFHLHREEAAWLCATTGETLDVLLNRVVSEQAGLEVQAFIGIGAELAQ